MKLGKIKRKRNLILDPFKILNLVPESSSQRVIIRMNKHGDGFMMNSYNEEYLKEVICQ